MVTTIKTRRTTIVQRERAQVGLRNITVLPEIQTRARTDKKVAKAYAQSLTDGSIFPPVLLYRLPDGRLILSDGFHRYEAHEAVGLTEIDAIIKDGTIEDAILAGITANFDENHLGKKVEHLDRVHAAEMMIRNEAFRIWGDKAIGQRCGLSRETVSKIRLRLNASESIPLPQRTLRLNRDGSPSGVMVPYKKLRGSGIRKIRRVGDGFMGCINGKDIYLGTDQDEAKAKMAEISASRVPAGTLDSRPAMIVWMRARGIAAAALTKPVIPTGGIVVGGTTIEPIGEVNPERVLLAVAKLLLARQATGNQGRAVLIGYIRSVHQAVTAVLPHVTALGIEVMTPEEFVAEFGPKEQAHAD